MSHVATQSQAVRARVQSWALASFDFGRVQLPGEEFAPPTPQQGSPLATSWVRVDNVGVFSDQIAIGSHGKRRHERMLHFDIFTPKGGGVSTAEALADSISNYFRDQADSSGALLYREPHAYESDTQEDPWYRWSVDIPYRYQFNPDEAILEVGYPVITVTQIAHGLAKGDWVYPSGVDTWAKAIATAGATLAKGLVISAPNADVVHIWSASGTVTVSNHGKGVAGDELFLSQVTEGADTTTDYVSGISQRVATVIDTHTLRVHDDIGEYK